VQPAAGGLSGHRLRISPASGTAAQNTGRLAFPAGGGMDLDLYLFRPLPGRYPAGVSAGDADRNTALGKDRGKVASALFCRRLEFFSPAFPSFSGSLQKNFVFCKNFVCICGKMGYNRVYENLKITKKAEKGYP